MNTSTADATLSQINSLDFFARARWGVKFPMSDGNTLQLECAKRRKIRITLDASDTYTIEIGKLARNYDYSVIASTSGVHAEELVRSVDLLLA